ncbi:MAG: helix-turn-helix domain-containing protein [Thermomicrobiales bacterium]
MISVNDILRKALPDPTRVVAGESGLGREVTWATRLRPAPPAFEHLSGGEIVLLPPHVLEMLDERLTLDQAIRQLSGFGVAAIALSDTVDEAARRSSIEAGIPLLMLPEGVDYSALERNTSRYITERRREIQRRGQEAGRRLMELAIGGESLEAMATDLSRLAGRAVAIEGRDGRILALSANAASRYSVSDPDAILLPTRATVQAWLRSVAATSSAEPPTATYPTDSGWSRIVAPVIGRDGLLGNVSLLVPSGEDVVEDGMLASRGAAAAAVALSREEAALSARQEIELNVLDEILDGALRSEVSLLQQSQRLGHDLNGTYVALIARVEPAPNAPARARDGRWSILEDGLQRAARDRNARIMWRVRNTSAEVIWPISTEGEVEEIVVTLRNDLNAAIAIHASTEVVSLGVGRARSGIEGIRQSHQEARQALTLGRRLRGPGHVTSFDQLGVYRLIYAAESLPELKTFQDEALGLLLDYDRMHGAELIKTLEAFFAANCSPKEAATLLHVHRNTVLYRLERIAEITGQDLNDADIRLRLHLALHVRLAFSA